MKKYLLAALYCLLPLYAFAGLFPDKKAVGEPHSLEGQSHISEKWIVWLDNESYWLMKPIQKRSQTWVEWWYSRDPLENQFDERFYFQKTSWSIGSAIQVHEVETTTYQDYPYILENLVTGEFAFAKVVCPNDIRLPKMQSALKFFDNPVSEPTSITRSLYHEIQTLDLDGKYWSLLESKDIQYWHYFKSGKSNDKILEWPDDEFLSSSADWEVSDPIQVYSQNWPSCESAGDYKKGCQFKAAYLLENKRSKKFIYAQPIEANDVIDLLLEFAEYQHKSGYNTGLNHGYAARSSLYRH